MTKCQSLNPGGTRTVFIAPVSQVLSMCKHFPNDSLGTSLPHLHFHLGPCVGVEGQPSHWVTHVHVLYLNATAGISGWTWKEEWFSGKVPDLLFSLHCASGHIPPLLVCEGSETWAFPLTAALTVRRELCCWKHKDKRGSTGPEENST